MTEPRLVLGDWQHVPRQVTVVGPKGERRAEVQTHQQWSILDPAHHKPVEWRVMFFVPDRAAYPFVFENDEEAERWARDSDAAADIQWPPSSGAETAAGDTMTQQSLLLYPKYGGEGGEPYVVPAPGGVTDWPGRKPHAAAVPNWMPRSFETLDRGDRAHLRGHDHNKPQQHIYVVGILRSNIPFAVLDSASSQH